MVAKLSPTVVQAQPEHLDLLAPLFDAYRQFYHQPPNPGGAREFLRQRLVNRDSVIFLARSTSEPTRAVGFVQLYPSFSSVRMRKLWILNDLFVTPQARKLGVARLLMERARQLGRETGAVALALETATDNEAAKALYRSLGYRREIGFEHYELTLDG